MTVENLTINWDAIGGYKKPDGGAVVVTFAVFSVLLTVVLGVVLVFI